MDCPHEEVVLYHLLFDLAMLHQVFDDRNQEILIVFPGNIPEIIISSRAECLEGKVAIKRVGQDDDRDQGLLGADLPEDLNCGRITRIDMDDDDSILLPGKGFRRGRSFLAAVIRSVLRLQSHHPTIVRLLERSTRRTLIIDNSLSGTPHQSMGNRAVAGMPRNRTATAPVATGCKQIGIFS